MFCCHNSSLEANVLRFFLFINETLTYLNLVYTPIYPIIIGSVCHLLKWIREEKVETF